MHHFCGFNTSQEKMSLLHTNTSADKISATFCPTNLLYIILLLFPSTFFTDNYPLTILPFSAADTILKQMTKYIRNYIKHKKCLFPKPYLHDPYPLTYSAAIVGAEWPTFYTTNEPPGSEKR